MKLKKSVEMVYVNSQYLKYLNSIDQEVYYVDTAEYQYKPHVGILITENSCEYVIPLTSAKEKHRNWKDSDSGYYRIYEVVDTRDYTARTDDILVDIKNHDILDKLPAGEECYYKQKILSVLDLRKMIPVKPEVYSRIPMEYSLDMSSKDINRRALLMKEWSFLTDIKDKIEEKCEKIYNKQITKSKVLKYYCNFKLLEAACATYRS